MSPAEFAYYSYASAVSKTSGVFYSDDRRDGREFGERGISKNSIGAYRAALEKRGWLRRIDTGPRRKRNSKTGQTESIRYEVLDHAAWARKHQGRCRFPRHDGPVPKNGTGQSQELGQEESTPVPNLDGASPNFHAHLSQNLSSPVPKSGAKTVKKDCERQTEGEEEALATLALSTAAPAPAVEVLSPVDAKIEIAFRSLNMEVFGDSETQKLWAEIYSRRNGECLSDLLEQLFVEMKTRRCKIGSKWAQLKRATEQREVTLNNGRESFADRNRREAHAEMADVREGIESVVRQMGRNLPKPKADEGPARSLLGGAERSKH
jgi:hypothetical protein